MSTVALSPRLGLPLSLANRHGLITGPTGSGKTVSLMTLAEGFAKADVPVFISDVKGDIGALKRSCRARFLDPFGGTMNLTFDALGPDLCARALELSPAQAGVLDIAFATARHGLNTLSDMRAALSYLSANRQEALDQGLGQITPSSLGVIQRALVRLEREGGGALFQPPCFDVAALMEPGLVTILRAERLMRHPRLYSSALLFVLSDLYDRLPEVGDLDRPRLVLFLDEAHLLFAECPPGLLSKIEQTIRLIRSKGVGVYFVSQSPSDVPGTIKAQLAHRIEHSHAQGVGQALVQTLDHQGRPLNPVKLKVSPPSCPLGALSEAELPRLAGVASGAQASGPAPVPVDWFAVSWVLLGLAAIVGLLIWTGKLGTVIAVLIGLGLGALTDMGGKAERRRR